MSLIVSADNKQKEIPFLKFKGTGIVVIYVLL